MTVEQRVGQSEDLIHWLDRLIEGLSVPSNDRAVITAAVQDVALEHHKSIVLTTRSAFHGSAFALLRLQFEAYVRGSWIRHCASDEVLERFKRKDKLDREFGELIKDLESKEAFNVGVLSQIKTNSWSDMNSFTHTGLLQIVRRITSTNVESRYPVDEIVGTLDFADSIALLATLAIVDVAVGKARAKEKLATRLLQRMTEFANANGR